MPHDTVKGTLGEFSAILARLEALRGQPYVSDAYIEFRIELLEAQRAVRRALVTAANGGSTPLGPQAESAGVPLTADTLVFDGELLRELLVAACAAAARHGQETDDLRRIADAAAADPDFLRTLAQAATFGPDQKALEALARRWGIYLDALLFVGRAAAAPFIAQAVATRKGDGEANPTGAEPHRCPACDSPPSIARLRRADGRRLLACSLCGGEWEAVRLGCACCGTQERTALGVLRLADADPRWIETCEKCQGYIKTVDERRLAEGETVFPVVEEAATLHMDLLAEREGYIRRVPYVLSA